MPGLKIGHRSENSCGFQLGEHVALKRTAEKLSRLFEDGAYSCDHCLGVAMPGQVNKHRMKNAVNEEARQRSLPE